MATYTSVEDINPDLVMHRYGLDDLQLEALHGGAANSSFKAAARQGDFVLTILDNHDQASARILAAHTRALFQRGIPTAEVVADIDGHDVPLIDGRPVLLKRWIPGEVMDPLPGHLLDAAGRLLAHLHTLEPDLPGLPVGTRRLSPELVKIIDTFADRQFADWLSTHLTTVRQREADLPSMPDVISHGDLFADNIIVRPDNTLAIIDWETVSLDSALLDLGMAILGLAKINGKLDQKAAAQVITGYHAVRPLTEEQTSALPTEVEHAALIIAFHRYYRHNIRFPNPRRAVSMRN